MLPQAVHPTADWLAELFVGKVAWRRDGPLSHSTKTQVRGVSGSSATGGITVAGQHGIRTHFLREWAVRWLRRLGKVYSGFAMKKIGAFVAPLLETEVWLRLTEERISSASLQGIFAVPEGLLLPATRGGIEVLLQ